MKAPSPTVAARVAQSHTAFFAQRSRRLIPRRLIAGAAIATAALLSACRDERPSIQGPLARPTIASHTAIPKPNAEKIAQRKAYGEEMLAELEENVSSAGGFFFTRDGVVNVWVADPSQSQRARTAIQGVLFRWGY